MAHVIAIANQKGGVGKTTTATNLASYLGKQGHRVLLVDLDPQGNTSSGFGVNKDELEREMYDVLTEELSVLDVALVSPYHGVEIAPTSQILAATEVELVSAPRREFRLKQAFENTPYDYILIDCPPSLGLLTLNGLVAANSLIVPVQAEYFALEGLSQLMNTVNRVRKALNPQLDLLGVVLTMHNGRMTLSNQVHDEVKRHFPDRVFDTIVPRNVRLAEAPSFGQPISHYDKWSKGARSYGLLAKEVHKRAQQRTKAKAGK